MRSRDVRQTFVDYFIKNNHLQLPSSSLIPPAGDKTVLLTTAGMQQMTPFFLGLQTPPQRRLTTVQKCFRTPDIDEVGDLSHLTFFEMLGNFSVGDYFKEGAINFAWELLTKVYGLEPNRLYPSIHPSDDEAYGIWTKQIGVPDNRIVRLEDNWWIAGETGPCGPDSEIYYDLGPAFDPDPNAQVSISPRYLEIWNLVFMQFNRNQDGKDIPLTQKNIDTGMGLERLSMILQGKSTIHETDLFWPIIERAAEIAGKNYGQNVKNDYSMRVIADHSRAVTFLIGDGVLPGTEGRSYVLRRILRRAIRHGRLLGLEKPFLTKTAQVAIDTLGDFYPEIRQRQNHIFRVIEMEEESFGRTLQSGLNRLEVLMSVNPLAPTSAQGNVEPIEEALDEATHGSRQISGEDAFDLVTSHGFPIDLIVELAAERGYSVDLHGYRAAMERHRDISRTDRFKAAGLNLDLYKSLKITSTPFRGYEGVVFEAPVLAIMVNGERVKQAEAGQDAEIVLAETPFYVESGGQVSDTGYIKTEAGYFQVENTFKPLGNMVVHQGRMAEGYIAEGDSATAVVEEDRRLDTARNHTGTHILHQALKDVLGNEVGQAGSLVAPERLRFDFTYLNPVTEEQLSQIQEIVNTKIRADLPVFVQEMPLEEARKSGAVMMFGEKYGDQVRVITIGDYSKELCGGTHLSRSGQIGLMVITAESSVGSGLRRIEAVTGRVAEKYVSERLKAVTQAAGILNTRPESVADEAAELKRRMRELERELANLQQKQAQSESGDLLNRAQEVDGIKVLATQVNAPTVDILRSVGDKLRDSLKSGVVAIGSVIEDAPRILVMVTPDLVKERGLKAGSLIGPMVAEVGGRGGGRPDKAEGGGKNTEKLASALALAPELVRSSLSQ
ncbi:MAG TPA: alanine--tRNA ligase [Chloroflexia bacterium]|nr:alanine--tRNA ligase [Chloroflexia bacterium]